MTIQEIKNRFGIIGSASALDRAIDIAAQVASTDLSVLPATAIERIEILRDGASAQYGSDAIAGVINIVLKKATGL